MEPNQTANDTLSSLPVMVSEATFKLEGERLEFFQSVTGIQDEEKLREHIIAVQRAALAVKPYPCIANFFFTHLRLAHVPGYDRMLELGRSRENPLYLEVGSCLGQDLRKAVFDGYPRECVIATDLVPEFWEIGDKLFRTNTTAESIPFIAGDLMDPTFLDVVQPSPEELVAPAPVLKEVKTLNELRGHLSVISLCAVFHVFDNEEAQLRLAKALACLLSPKPGSMILGMQVGSREKGKISGKTMSLFCHSPESWTDMWDGQVFEKGSVKVDARLVVRQKETRKDGNVLSAEVAFLEWCVTRL